MNWELLIELIGIVLAWPVVLGIVVFVFRSPIARLIESIKKVEVEGPGDTKIKLSADEVEEIVNVSKDAAQVTEEELTKRIESIVNRAILDTRELRIMRALITEDSRSLYGYRSSYYEPAFRNLVAKGYVEKRGEKYSLTEAGTKAAKEYLRTIL